LIAPAMNPKMWHIPAVQENIATWRRRGVASSSPESGEMGGVHEEAGVGRMSEPAEIADALEQLLSVRSAWIGRRVIVTSGPTREPIDPVRFVSNRSSGVMGDALACAARMFGAEVTLIRGRGAAGPAPAGVKLVEVDTAAEMFEAVKTTFPGSDLLVMAAAVADWSVKNPATGKLKKSAGAPVIEWGMTEDILNWAGYHRTTEAVVGFALETGDHLTRGQKKLAEKGADMIVINDPTRADSAFGGDTTRLTLLTTGEAPEELALLPKRLAAMAILERAERFLKV